MNLRTDKPEYIKPTEYTSRPLGKIELYAGLVGDLGIEQIYKSTDKFNAFAMNLRARMNPHRNLRVFTCAIKKKYVEDFSKIDPIKLYKLLRKISIKFLEDKI
jgi:hypothetical protein